MSGDVKVPASQVRPLAERVVADLSELCERIEIAGSLRRGKPYVGDVEIVVLPKRAPELLARLDGWIINGRAFKAHYSDGRTRWGSKYRGLAFPRADVKVEVFLADADNWGYQHWLRTGPGDANQYVMSQCIARRAPYRAVEGYWCVDGHRLRVAEEAELFRLLGMQYVYPSGRTLAHYTKFMTCRWVSDYVFAESESAAPTMRQEGLC